jgi:diphthamide biosynthesis protein 2
MADQLAAPPVLSTSDTHIFEDPTADPPPRSQRLTDDEIHRVYEIERTAREVAEGVWKRVALQFPDHMLCDATRVFEGLAAALRSHFEKGSVTNGVEKSNAQAVEVLTEDMQEVDIAKKEAKGRVTSTPRLFILADTSYGACCVDEIAAEHVDADVVVHYGRSCLSPTARLPVIYVYTSQPLDHSALITAFEETFPEKDTKVVLLGDITYNEHIVPLHERLQVLGYTAISAPSIVHDPSSPLPNRTLPDAVADGTATLSEYCIFHISDPAPALLLTLASRVKDMFIFPATTSSSSSSPSSLVIQASTQRALMRRYALLTSLTTCPIFGILVNTLSVKNYLTVISSLQAQIAAAGKKSYTFVVGKVNPAKVANFSEVGGWVVVGCWESSLLESRDFYRPIITPFELQLALQGDGERVWTGEWRGDFGGVAGEGGSATPGGNHDAGGVQAEGDGDGDGEFDDEDDSAPPEFDLRSGRYVSHSRPMRLPKLPASTVTSSTAPSGSSTSTSSTSRALTLRANGDVAQINGTASPGAEFLRSQRTWTGLGSDFVVEYDDEDGDAGKGAVVEQGRGGVARGYRVGGEGHVR